MMQNIVVYFLSKTFFFQSLDSPEADPNSRIQVQVVYLGGDSRKHH